MCVCVCVCVCVCYFEIFLLLVFLVISASVTRLRFDFMDHGTQCEPVEPKLTLYQRDLATPDLP